MRVEVDGTMTATFYSRPVNRIASNGKWERLVEKAYADTLTVNPDANPETNSWDGYSDNQGPEADYAAVHDATSANTENNDSGISLLIENSDVGADFAIRRTFVGFLTSSIGAASTINSATFSLKGKASVVSDDSDSVTISSVTTASNTAINANDYNKTNFGTAIAATKTMASWSTSAYNDFTVTDLTAISKTGVTKIGARSTRDVAGTAPTGQNTVTAHSADTADTTQDPKLVVNFGAGGGSAPIITLFSQLLLKPEPFFDLA